MTHNVVEGRGGHGLAADANTLTGSVIAHNVSSDNALDGINLAAGNSDNGVEHNRAERNGSDGIHAQGATGNAFLRNLLFDNVDTTPTTTTGPRTNGPEITARQTLLRAPSATPSRALSARGLKAFLYAGGTVATGAGLSTVVLGARSVLGEEQANPAIESELRFYSAFYVAYGLAMLRVAPRAEGDAASVRALAATLFLAVLARAGGWRAAGRPQPGQQALLALELVLPPLIVLWQRAGD